MQVKIGKAVHYFSLLLGGEGRERDYLKHNVAAAGRRRIIWRDERAPVGWMSARRCRSVAVSPSLAHGPAGSRAKPQAARGAQPQASTERVRISSAALPWPEQPSRVPGFEGVSDPPAPLSRRRGAKKSHLSASARVGGWPCPWPGVVALITPFELTNPPVRDRRVRAEEARPKRASCCPGA